jgi:beta-mannosidase
MSEPFGYAPEKIVFQRYAEDTARFVSEFGIQAAPALATLKRWMDPADLDPDSEGFHLRIKDESKKALAMIAPETGPAETLQDYIDFTQWTQAEGLKFGIEHFRRRRPHCSGALLWQFNDCWPCISWSLVDYDGVEKAAFHSVRRAFAPILASFKALEGDAVELWITNDARDPAVGRAVVELAGLNGQVIWSEQVDFDIPSGASRPIWSGAAPASIDHVLTVRSPDDVFLPNRKLLAPIAQVALDRKARPAVVVRMCTDGSLHIDLEAKAYLAFVHAVSDRPDLVFSDNHFDMTAGERRTISVKGAAPVTSDEITLHCWNAAH